MAKTCRYLTKNGNVSVMAIDSTDIVYHAEKTHETSAVVTAALGRLLSAASLMGSMLKGKNDSVTLRIDGKGPIGPITAVSDNNGNVKGYAANKIVELPLSSKGKLDVGRGVGCEGHLSVIKDLGLKEPYIGQSPIVSGEIAEDITHYFAVSEQIPAVCALGVLINPDLSVNKAGGLIIQLLPSHTEKDISLLEKNIKQLDAITEMLASGLTPDDICKLCLSGFKYEKLSETYPLYKCDCSEAKVERALISLGKNELIKLKEESPIVEVHCEFCEKNYNIDINKFNDIL